VILKLLEVICLQFRLTLTGLLSRKPYGQKKTLEKRIKAIAFPFNCRAVSILEPNKPTKLVEHVVEEKVVKEIRGSFQNETVNRIHRNEINATSVGFLFVLEKHYGGLDV